MKKGVLLLADTFEKFISTNLKYYNLDPYHCFSAPGLSWDAILKMTEVELEKNSDPDTHLFIEKGMRGGISYVSKRYSKANNKYCPYYDKEKPKSFIIYLDMNNLYGHVMSQYLPYGGFKWIKNTNETINRILNKKDDSLHGYFLEVDLDYPKNLQRDYSDYPLAPKKGKIKRESLSPYSLKNANEFDIKTGIINKLTPNVMTKNNYVVHYRNLKHYLSKGLILKKVHKILEFKQSVWMKPYIDFNTQKRKEATNAADKNHFKLLNNAVYGKTMENMRKRIKLRIIKEEKDLIKYVSRPTYINHDIFGKRLVAVHERKELLTLNKPICVGCTVLELSKLEIYKFHYDFMKDNVNIFNLIFTDIDSFVYETSENFYEIMYQHKQIFDLINQHKNSKFFCNDKKTVLGKMKDEYGGRIIYEITALK